MNASKMYHTLSHLLKECVLMQRMQAITPVLSRILDQVVSVDGFVGFDGFTCDKLVIEIV